MGFNRDPQIDNVLKDSGALSPKWDVFIKSIPLRLLKERKGKREVGCVEIWGRSKKNSVKSKKIKMYEIF